MEKTPDADRVPASPLVIKTSIEFDNVLGALDPHMPLLIQFTSTWCRRCKPLTQEVSDTFDSTLKWIVVDVGENENIQDRFQVTALPRFDVYFAGKTKSAEGFDATVAEVGRMLTEAQAERPTLEFTDDF